MKENNLNNLPIIKAINEEAGLISEEKKMEKNYNLLTFAKKDLDGITAKLEALELGFDGQYLIDHLNKYIKECEKDDQIVYFSPKTAYDIIWRADFDDYFKKFLPDDRTEKMERFSKILNEIFVTNKFTSLRKTISHKENVTPPQNTPPAKNYPRNWDSHLGYTQTPEPKEND